MPVLRNARGFVCECFPGRLKRGGSVGQGKAAVRNLHRVDNRRFPAMPNSSLPGACLLSAMRNHHRVDNGRFPAMPNSSLPGFRLFSTVRNSSLPRSCLLSAMRNLRRMGNERISLSQSSSWWLRSSLSVGNSSRNSYGCLFSCRNRLGNVDGWNCDFNKTLRKVDGRDCDFAKFSVKITDGIATLTILSVRFTEHFAANLCSLKSWRKKLRVWYAFPEELPKNFPFSKTGKGRFPGNLRRREGFACRSFVCLPGNDYVCTWEMTHVTQVIK